MASKHRHSHEDVPVVPDALSAEEAANLAFASDKTLTKHHFTEGEHPIVRIEHLNKSFDKTLAVIRQLGEICGMAKGQGK